MSQRALSALVGRSPAYVSKLEGGLIDPSLRGFAEVAVALGMSPLEVWTIIRCEAAETVTSSCDTHTCHSHSQEQAS